MANTIILNGVEVNILCSMSLLDAKKVKNIEEYKDKNVIYCIHNTVNKKNYIGQTTKIINRFTTSSGHWGSYKKFLKGTLKENSMLYAAFKKYSPEKFYFYIIELCEDKNSLNEREIYWIKVLHTCVLDEDCRGYNLTRGGTDFDHMHTEKTRTKAWETRRKNKTDKLSPESISKARETKLRRYGTLNFTTPESLESRKSKLLERYGVPYVPVTEEMVKKRKETCAEKYGGDPLGYFHTPEVIEKAAKNRTITRLISKINSNINILFNNDINVANWDKYWKGTLNIMKDRCYHIRSIIKNLDLLKSDNRWTPIMEKIFSNVEENYNSSRRAPYCESRYNKKKGD